MNVYYQDEGIADLEMFSSLLVYGGTNPLVLNVPNTSQVHTLDMEQYSAGSSDVEYLWLIQGHTHQLGTGYNIFTRNSDGSKGDQVYSGTYDYENGFDTGVYEYDHPPVREFMPFYEMKMNEGLVHEASWYNDGPADVGFGLTTADEMFITYYQYTKSPLSTSIKETDLSGLKLYPNPTENTLVLELENTTATEYELSIFDLSGKSVLSQNNLTGQRQQMDVSMLSSGTYVVFIQFSNGDSYRQKLVKN